LRHCATSKFLILLVFGLPVIAPCGGGEAAWDINRRAKLAAPAAKPRGVNAMKKLLLLCVVLSLLFLVFAPAFAADDMGKSETVKGWVSDSKCGAKGANASAAECTKKCLGEGAKMVVVTDKDKKVLAVDNPDALQDHVGHHVAVSGHVMGDSIHVDSVKML
jgi:hypothetical protein